MIPKVDLIRTENGNENDAIIGQFRLEGKLVCYSIEDEKDLFPVGLYMMHRFKTVKFAEVMREWSLGETLWKLIDVEGKEDIEIHPANFPSELEGCVATGTYPDYMPGGGRCVRDSRVAFAAFMRATAHLNNLMLNVMEVY